MHSLYYRRRSCRTRIENGAERKRKKEKTTKVRRPIIPLHIHILLLTLSFLFFFLSLSFSVLPAGGNLTKLCANSENLALVGPFATNVSSNEARVGCPIPTSWVWDREKKKKKNITDIEKIIIKTTAGNSYWCYLQWLRIIQNHYLWGIFENEKNNDIFSEFCLFLIYKMYFYWFDFSSPYKNGYIRFSTEFYRWKCYCIK